MPAAHDEISVQIKLQQDLALPDAVIHISTRDDFTRGDTTSPFNYVTIQQGDQKVILPQRELRKALEAIYAIFQ